MPVHYAVDGAVATVTLDRPEALNALDPDALAELRRHLVAARDDAVRAIVITGAGERAFCVGADLKRTPPSADPYARAWNASDEAAAARRLHPAAEPGAAGDMEATDRRGERPLPRRRAGTGAAVRPAGGGRHRLFALPEVRVGSVAGVCGPQLLRSIPAAHAMELLLTGARIDAAEALRIGLISDVWPAARLLDEARSLAEAIAANAPLSAAATKRLARETDALPRAALFDLTEMAFGVLKDTEDCVEGRRAFAEKRPPRFVGR